MANKDMNRKEALEFMRRCLIEDNGKVDTEVKEAIQALVPELKESEDERIRQKLIKIVGYFRSRGIDHQLCDDFLTYLEKQKPANPFSGTGFDYNGHHYGMCARDNGIEVTKDGVIIYRFVPPFIGQNPVWDEDRKAIFIPIINKYLDAKHSEKEMTWDDAMEYAKKAGKELPSKHEMFAILFFKNEINKILDEHGGDFLNEWAWTSSEIPNNEAFIVCLNNGRIIFSLKRDHNYAYTVAAKVDLDMEDVILKEAVPKDDLTEEEFNEAKRIWEINRFYLDVVKYIYSVRPKEGLKWAKTYFDLYIDDRNYDKV